VKELDPIGLQRRTNDMQRHQEEYIVPSLDYICVISGVRKVNRTSAALGIYMVLGVLRFILSTVVFWRSWQVCSLTALVTIKL